MCEGSKGAGERGYPPLQGWANLAAVSGQDVPPIPSVWSQNASRFRAGDCHLPVGISDRKEAPLQIRHCRRSKRHYLLCLILPSREQHSINKGRGHPQHTLEDSIPLVFIHSL